MWNIHGKKYNLKAFLDKHPDGKKWGKGNQSTEPGARCNAGSWKSYLEWPNELEKIVCPKDNGNNRFSSSIIPVPVCFFFFFFFLLDLKEEKKCR